MKKLSLTITLISAVLLSACGSKKTDEEKVAEAVKKETYNIMTDSKEIMDKAKDAADTMEDAAKKQKEKLDSL